MLSSADDFKSQIETVQPNDNKVVGITDFVGKVADFLNEMQAGPDGDPGIFTFGNAAMISGMSSMLPVKDGSWVGPFVDAFISGITTATITPGTVTDPAWVGSGDLDTETSPVAATTIVNIPAVQASMISSLTGTVATKSDPLPMATAIRNAALVIVFTCIGLGAEPVLPPIPLPFTAQ